MARFAHNEAAGALFRSLDYAYLQTYWMMRIELDGPPSTPPETEGITIRTFDPERDALATHAAMAEAFLDHRGHEFPSYEQWRHHHIDGEGARFDPRLWFVAADGDEIVGAAICRPTTARDRECAEVDIARRAPRVAQAGRGSRAPQGRLRGVPSSRDPPRRARCRLGEPNGRDPAVRARRYARGLLMGDVGEGASAWNGATEARWRRSMTEVGSPSYSWAPAAGMLSTDARLRSEADSLVGRTGSAAFA